MKIKNIVGPNVCYILIPGSVMSGYRAIIGKYSTPLESSYILPIREFPKANDNQ